MTLATWTLFFRIVLCRDGAVVCSVTERQVDFENESLCLSAGAKMTLAEGYMQGQRVTWTCVRRGMDKAR